MINNSNQVNLGAANYREPTLSDANLASATGSKLADLGIAIHEVKEGTVQTLNGFTRSFTPATVLVSTVWPGIRQWSLTEQPNDERAIASMIAENMTDDLLVLRSSLANTPVISQIINKLLPRAGVPVRTRQYFVMESSLYDITNRILANEGGLSTSPHLATIASLYVHVIKHALAKMGCISRTLHTAVITEAESHIVNTSSIRKAVVMETILPFISQAQMETYYANLDQQATPEVIAAVIIEVMTRIEKALPSVIHRTNAIKTAVAVTLTAILQPDSLPNDVIVDPVVVELTEMVNFMADAAAQPDIYRDVLKPLSVYEMLNHCKIALEAINTAKLFQKLPIEQFKAYFGFVPCASIGAPVNGLVVYTHSGQQAKAQIVDARLSSGGYEIGPVASEHVAVTSITGAINSQLLALSPMTAIANLIADDLARSLQYVQTIANVGADSEGETLIDGLAWASKVVTIGCTNSDIVALAMCLSHNVRMTESGTFTYEVTIPDYMLIGSQISGVRSVIVNDPYEAILYINGNKVIEPAPMPQREQCLAVNFAHDTWFPKTLERRLDMNVMKPYVFTLKASIPTTIGAPHREVDLRLPVLTMPTIVHETTEVPTQIVAYALCREPATAQHIDRILSIATMYAKHGDEQTRMLAKSWLVEAFAGLITTPAVTTVAQRALSYALRTASVDTRRTSTIIKQLTTLATTGTTLALLSRFGYIPGDRVAQVLAVIPKQELTGRAAITAAIANETVVQMVSGTRS